MHAPTPLASHRPPDPGPASADLGDLVLETLAELKSDGGPDSTLTALLEPASVGHEASAVLSLPGGSQVFGWRVGGLATRSGLGRASRSYARGFRRRRADLLRALLGVEGNALEVRLLVEPGPEPERDQLTLALMQHLDETERAQAQDVAASTRALLRSTLPEYDLVALDEDELGRLLRPFRASTAVAFERRWARLPLVEALRPPAHDEALAENELLQLLPFAPRVSTLERVLRLIQARRERLALCLRLSRVALRPAEAAWLEQQRARAEHYARHPFAGPAADPPSAWRPTRAAEARLQERRLSAEIETLRNAAFEANVWLVGERRISAAVSHAVGVLLTGGRPQATSRAVPREVSAVSAYSLRRLSPSSEAAWQPPHPGGVAGLPAEAARLTHLFGGVPAAGLLLLPPAARQPLPGVSPRLAQRLQARVRFAAQGPLLGTARGEAGPLPFRLSPADRLQHAYVCGQTGTGKSTLLANMILDDIRAGAGVCVVDPHGDLFEDVLARLPRERAHEVVLLDPADEDWPVGLNLLECAHPDERLAVVDAFLSIFERLLADQYGAKGTSEYAGPIFWQHCRMSLSLLTADPGRPASLLDFTAFFQEPGYWRRFLPLRSDDPQLQRWVENVLPHTDYLKQGEYGALGTYIGSKFEPFVFTPALRLIFGQERSTIDLRAAMDQGRIVLVNLARGWLSDLSARFLGMVFLGKLQAAAMARARQPRHLRRPFHVYVDEFGFLATRFFASLLSEGRKFGLALVLANQYLGQIQDEQLRESLFGNVGTLVGFRLGASDGERVARELGPPLRAHDLVHLPNFEAYARTLLRGERVAPFSLSTAPPASVADPGQAARVRALSRCRYGRPRAEVEAAIRLRLVG